MIPEEDQVEEAEQLNPEWDENPTDEAGLQEEKQ